jgi:hypothetical protein
MVNARKIRDEFNIFSGVFLNRMFVVIWLTILVLQCLITQFTQDVFVVCRDGLAWHQWLISFALGISVWPIDFLIKLYPDKLCFSLDKKTKGKDEEDEEK